MANTRSLLLPGQSLRVGEMLTSANGYFTLVLQRDGNIVLYRVQNSQALWSTETHGQPIVWLEMQTDSNLVAYKEGRSAVWHTHTWQTDARKGSWLLLQDDGNLVMFDKDKTVRWSSKTAVNIHTPTISTKDQENYTFNEVSEWWKHLCRDLPWSRALKWPGYETDVIGDEINGQSVIIQVRKGFHPKHMNLPFMPGGFGTEVGVYKREPSREIPETIPFLPESLARWIIETLRGVDTQDLWWPAPELNAELEFSLINPITQSVVVSAGPQRGYWLAKWMDEWSFMQYSLGRPSGIPESMSSYILRYRVDEEWRTWPEPVPRHTHSQGEIIPNGMEILPWMKPLIAAELVKGPHA